MLLDNRFYSTEEVAEKLDVSLREVRRILKLGQMKAYRIGKRLGVKPEDFNNYCESKIKPYESKFGHN